jgi:hypothetical protein
VHSAPAGDSPGKHEFRKLGMWKWNMEGDSAVGLTGIIALYIKIVVHRDSSVLFVTRD